MISWARKLHFYCQLASSLFCPRSTWFSSNITRATGTWVKVYLHLRRLVEHLRLHSFWLVLNRTLTLLPPATKLWQGNVSTPVCQSFCSQGSLCPSMHQRSHDQGVSLSGVSLSRVVSVLGVYVQGVSVQGGLCLGHLYLGRSLSRVVYVRGGLCPGGVCPGVSLSRGSMSKGVSLSSGCLSRGVSIRGVSVREIPPDRDPARALPYGDAFLLL